jgi:hypothetical protein
MGGGALQRVYRVHLARAEQKEDARDAGLDKRAAKPQPPRQGSLLDELSRSLWIAALEATKDLSV